MTAALKKQPESMVKQISFIDLKAQQDRIRPLDINIIESSTIDVIKDLF